MANKLGTLWKVTYEQRFGRSQVFTRYEDTFFGPDELTAAVTKFRSTALAQTTTEGKCQEVRIHSIASIAAITLKV